MTSFGSQEQKKHLLSAGIIQLQVLSNEIVLFLETLNLVLNS